MKNCAMRAWVALCVVVMISAGCGGTTSSPSDATPSSSTSLLGSVAEETPGLPTLMAPEGLAIGPEGAVYVSDFDGNHVFRIEADGRLTVVAGNGTSGLAEDGTPALDAPLGEPAGIAFDTAGRLYVMDHHNHRVRLVDGAGAMSTVAGSGLTGRGAGSFGGDGGPAVDAHLAEPIGIAFDAAGNLYVADSVNHRIRRIDSTGVITTFAGSGALSGISPLNDGTPALDAALANPWYLAFAQDGSLYFSDVGLGGVFRIDLHGRLFRMPATVHNPNGVDVDADGNLFIASTDDQRIIKVAADGKVTTIAGTGGAGYSGDGGPAIDAEIHDPFGLVVDTIGNVYFADSANHRVRRVDPSGTITTVAGG